MISKRFLRALFAVCLFGFAAFGVAGAHAQAPATVVAASEANLITVQGSGEVQAAPDIARLRMGVVTQNAQVSEASAQNAQKSAALIKAIKAAGVADKDLQTSDYSVTPQFNYGSTQEERNRPPKLAGYQVSNTVSVVIRKIADAGRVLDAAIKSGANDVGNLTFDLNEDTRAKAQADALTRAVADAKSKADVLVKAAGLTAIRLFSISEGGGYVAPRPYALSAARGAVASETPVQSGELTVSASITVQYRFNN